MAIPGLKKGLQKSISQRSDASFFLLRKLDFFERVFVLGSHVSRWRLASGHKLFW